MLKIFCPFCLTIHDFGEPPVCTERLDEGEKHPDVPRSYIQNYERSQPQWLAAIGFSGHGKTCYIGSLSLLLDKADEFWEGSATDYLDQYTFQQIQDARKTVFERKVYDRTPKWDNVESEKKSSSSEAQVPPRPLLIRINAIPQFRSRCLVLYDAAGEYFESLTGIPEGMSESGYIKSLKAVRTIWFMVSLSDLASPENSGSKSLRDLLNVYISGMEGTGWDIKNRNLIVVYTKADKLRNIESVPSSIRDYLFSDPYGPMTSKLDNANANTFFQGVERAEFRIEEYLAEMERVSSDLREYTRKLPGGAAFLNLAADYKLKVNFTITSALGTDLQDGEAIADFVSYRVLDPLLWALQLDKETPIPTTIKLILDTNPLSVGDNGNHGSNPVLSVPFELLIRELGKIGDEVVTYYLGRSQPCALSGKEPPAEPPKQTFSRLLKPLLLNEDTHTLALILTNGPIIDLDDLADIGPQTGIGWLDRLFVVSLSSEYEPDWQYAMNVKPGEGIEPIINQFRRMLQETKMKGE